jgi:hypothetical protein
MTTDSNIFYIDRCSLVVVCEPNRHAIAAVVIALVWEVSIEECRDLGGEIEIIQLLS